MPPIGFVPQSGFATQDGDFINGITQGHNSVFQSGLTSLGNSQATAFQLADRITLFEADTVAANTGVAICPALGGVEVSIYNNGASTLTVYPSITNNPVTGAQDTINNTTSITIASHNSMYFFCAKNGVWAAK